ncbi:MAG: Ig-like domain-containing protein [Gemmataceae bacterium]
MSHMCTSPRWLLALAALLLSVASLPADQPEKLPPGRKLVKVTATPAKIELTHKFSYAQVLLTGVLDNGDTLDLTRMAELKNPPTAVKVDDRRLVRPIADGSGTLEFRFNGKSVNIPFTVTNQKKHYKVSYVRDVIPVMSKAGCNAGTCHGAQKGKNGFQLSLRGYDPTYDYRALTDDIMGRRFNRAAPDRSLMLLKPTGEVAHVGGVLMQPGDPKYEIIRSWINDGVKLDADTPRVASIRVIPGEAVIPLPDMKQQMQVIATYPNGETRDVTAEAFLESSNTEVAKVDERGLVRAIRRGETAILARYEGKYVAAPLIVMGDRRGFVWKEVPEYNYIDSLVYAKLKRVKVQA